MEILRKRKNIQHIKGLRRKRRAGTYDCLGTKQAGLLQVSRTSDSSFTGSGMQQMTLQGERGDQDQSLTQR
jgi:hypothetical protein